VEGRPSPAIMCAICRKSVKLELDLNADETGKAVHKDCYVRRLFSKRSAQAAPVIAGLGRTPKLLLNIWRNIRARVPQTETRLAALKELPRLVTTTEGLEELSKTIEHAEPQVAKHQEDGGELMKMANTHVKDSRGETSRSALIGNRA
jgi:hypothetical protein